MESTEKDNDAGRKPPGEEDIDFPKSSGDDEFRKSQSPDQGESNEGCVDVQSDVRGEGQTSTQKEEQTLPSPGCSTEKDVRVSKPNNEEQEEDCIEVLDDTVENAGSEGPREGIPEEVAGQAVPEAAGGSRNGDRRAQLNQRRDASLREEEENYVHWLDRLPARASFGRLLCIWARKFYGWIAIGLACLTSGIVVYLLHHPLVKVSNKERLVTTSVLVLSAFAFLAKPLVRLWALLQARGPRFNFIGLRNMIDLD